LNNQTSVERMLAFFDASIGDGTLRPSFYDEGSNFKNFQAVLGERPLLWFVPSSQPERDGYAFPASPDPF